METLIILTTTVYIDVNKYYIFQDDPQERIDIYLKSINRWLNETDFNILLVENSGYPFKELQENPRIHVISFKEKDLPEANYLLDNNSKGASELFAINYSFKHCKFIDQTDFVIKVTGRYFIPYFKEYINNYIKDFDAICQNGIYRCEVIGCNKKFFDKLFNISLLQDDGWYCNHIEFLYSERLNKLDKILMCKPLSIPPTQHGGIDKVNNFL